MSIQAFISQPVTDSVHAAYRPVTIRVSATANNGGGLIPPVVYCDIYFNDVYYKTHSKTQYTLLGGSNSEWEFDLQDAAQEYLRKYLASIAHSDITEATPIIAKVFCRMRCSGINDDGFIEHDGTAPVQGTSSSNPVSGTGTQSNTFFIVNATLQHADVQDITSHLNYFKQRTWAADVFPLTHRPEGYAVLPTDSDSFPILDIGNHAIRQLRLNYRNCNQNTFGQASISAGQAPTCSANISTPLAVHNLSGWLVNWSLAGGASPAKYFISTPAVSAGAPHETTSTFYQLPELAEGEHVITVRPLCFIEGEYYPGTAKTVTITVSPCEDLFLDPVPNLPDAVAGVAYDYSIEFSGSAPLSLSNITKPAWMTISASGNFVNHTGTPAEGDAGTGIEVSYTVSNCGTPEIDIDQTIDVTIPEVTGTIQIANQVAGISIDGLEPSTWYSIGSGSFPVANGQSISGQITDAYTGIFGFNITKVGPTTGYLRLTVDSVLIDCLPVTASGSYTFDTTIALDSQVEAILSTTPC